MKFLLAIISILFLLPSLNGQNAEEAKKFDSIYFNVAVNISATNPQRANQIADSLYLHSNLQIQQLRALMLKAQLLEDQGRSEESIENTLAAQKIAEETDDYEWQAKIYGFLSSQYRNIGFLDQGRIYLKKGIAVSSQIENKKKASLYRGMTYQEMAYYSIEEGKYREALEHVKMASFTFKVVQNERMRNYLSATNEELFGRSYAGLGAFRESKIHFNKTLAYLRASNTEKSQLGSLSYLGLGKVFLKQNQIDSAGIYLKKALRIASKTEYAQLNESIYKNLATYYKEKKLLDSFVYFEDKHNAILQENTFRSRKSVNSEFNRLNKNILPGSTNTLYVFFGAIVLVLAVTLYIVKLQRRSKAAKVVEANEDKKNPSLILPQKTEEELLAKLDEFEAAQGYLDKNISFSILAGKLGTNAKYLNLLIKSNKNKDYNSYISELRIQYIVDKLKTDPDYLNYKISFLAEECGFSSHSKFSAHFKKIVNLSPSEFIDSLRN